MRKQWGTLLALGFVVAAEAALGVMLVVNGGGVELTPNPWRVGEGYPQPPPCAAIDKELVADLIHTTVPPVTTDKREDDDPTRICEFGKDGPDTLTITMRSRINNLALEINKSGPSPLDVYDNLTRQEVKRYSDQVVIRFGVDNLDVLVDFRARRTMPRIDGDLPTAENAERLRSGAVAIAQNLSDKLAVRNRTTPTSPPSQR